MICICECHQINVIVDVCNCCQYATEKYLDSLGNISREYTDKIAEKSVSKWKQFRCENYIELVK